MIPGRIENATHHLEPPQEWDEQGRPCSRLWVRQVVEDGLTICESAWEPTPAELAALAEGGSVVLRVVGGQPPVMLYVETPPEEGQ